MPITVVDVFPPSGLDKGESDESEAGQDYVLGEVDSDVGGPDCGVSDEEGSDNSGDDPDPTTSSVTVSCASGTVAMGSDRYAAPVG